MTRVSKYTSFFFPLLISISFPLYYIFHTLSPNCLSFFLVNGMGFLIK